MGQEFKWGNVFLDRHRTPSDKSFARDIVLNLSECPDCGYVFINAAAAKNKIMFTHVFARKRDGCSALMSDIRTAYHVKRATRIVMGKVRL